ncbi:uncharacterized protein N7443_003678 [Penicillium atrosanguineum]|uniref:uncharacterized protein n=1 Tax=Penicillium atrosanguineum TaxID=1132637 RepID=UPI0023A510D3|nr:uncharacterized protein N7443_003678 [Penicillium atrosanguineum]KAJ5304018.1 hypothetical protein N7443_003678 [Penicillium atrosanguineum]
MTPPQGLEVAIIGGGLAGALTARVLREAHRVTIYERAKDAGEVGAALAIGPTGVRILESLGFDQERAGSIPTGLIKLYDHKGNLGHEQYLDTTEAYGAEHLAYHRSDLRNEFLRLATADSEQLGINGCPAKIVWGCEVTAVDAEAGTLILSTGEKIHADLIVAADGIKSVARPVVVGDAAFSTTKASGISAFRFLIETQEIQDKMGHLPKIFKPLPGHKYCLTMLFSTDGSKRGMVIYPCRNFELVNFLCFVTDDKLKVNSTRSWSAPGDREEMVSLFSDDFPDWAVDHLRLADNIKLWQLHDQDPLPTYTVGRVVLIGDAAHAMTPHQGQGATQAVEDAEGFRLFLRAGTTRDGVPTILKDYDSVRRPRASQIQLHTRAAQSNRKPEDALRYEKYNWTYPGIIKGLERVKAGEELIQF